MLAPVLIWSVLVPGLIALALLLAARPWASADGVRAAWAPVLAVSLGYIAGNWGLTGGPGGEEAVNARLLYVAGLAVVVGLVEVLWVTIPAALRWWLRIVTSAGMAWLVVAPLIEPQQWGASELALRIAALGGAAMLAWSVLDLVARREAGPSLALGLVLLGAGGSVVVVLSGLASTGQLTGTLVSTLGAALVVCWRWPVIGRLRGVVAPVALLLAAHWGNALLYAEMPPASFALLAVAPLALLVSWLPVLSRAAATLALIARLSTVAIPVGGAAAIAATEYFADSAASSPQSPSTGDTKASDDDYGYD